MLHGLHLELRSAQDAVVQPGLQRAVDEQHITQEQPVSGCVRQKGETALKI